MNALHIHSSLLHICGTPHPSLTSPGRYGSCREWLYTDRSKRADLILNRRLWVTKPFQTSMADVSYWLITPFFMSAKSLWVRAENIHKEMRDWPLTLYSQGNWGLEKRKDYPTVTCSLFFYTLFKWLSQGWITRHLVSQHGAVFTSPLCLFNQKGLNCCHSTKGVLF